jgi:hypothetical protein
MNQPEAEARELAPLEAYLHDQVSKGSLDTARMDWCEANLNHLGWIGNRAVICDHVGVADSARGVRKVIDKAMARITPASRIDDQEQFCVASASINHPSAELIANRYRALLQLVTGKHARDFLQELCWDGSTPTQEKLEAQLDKMIEAAA